MEWLSDQFIEHLNELDYRWDNLEAWDIDEMHPGRLHLQDMQKMSGDDDYRKPMYHYGKAKATIIADTSAMTRLLRKLVSCLHPLDS